MKFNKKVFKVMLVLVAVLYVGYILIEQQLTIASNRDRISIQNIQVAELKDETARLNNEKEIMNTPEYKERIARERGGLVKRNETMFVDSLAN